MAQAYIDAMIHVQQLAYGRMSLFSKNSLKCNVYTFVLIISSKAFSGPTRPDSTQYISVLTQSGAVRFQPDDGYVSHVCRTAQK